ncbi:hypothetical protein [Actinocorallia populi]|uniref:hypothetical protein n=1 Tax=Actinocorallia populi TaxID=2079200 RepID=UPI0013006066|nr:hypothetical protein [Actinocorallia populi]
MELPLESSSRPKDAGSDFLDGQERLCPLVGSRPGGDAEISCPAGHEAKRAGDEEGHRVGFDAADAGARSSWRVELASVQDFVSELVGEGEGRLGVVGIWIDDDAELRVTEVGPPVASADVQTSSGCGLAELLPRLVRAERRVWFRLWAAGLRDVEDRAWSPLLGQDPDRLLSLPDPASGLLPFLEGLDLRGFTLGADQQDVQEPVSSVGRCSFEDDRPRQLPSMYAAEFLLGDDLQQFGEVVSQGWAPSIRARAALPTAASLSLATE